MLRDRISFEEPLPIPRPLSKGCPPTGCKEVEQRKLPDLDLPLNQGSAKEYMDPAVWTT